MFQTISNRQPVFTTVYTGIRVKFNQNLHDGKYVQFYPFIVALQQFLADVEKCFVRQSALLTTEKEG